MSFFEYLLLAALLFSVIPGNSGLLTKCKRVKLESLSNKLTTHRVAEAAEVLTLSLDLEWTPCVRNKTYGFKGQILWTHLGCSGFFIVCYIPGENLRLACSSQEGASKTCDLPCDRGKLTSVRLEKQRTSSPCIKNYSYFIDFKMCMVMVAWDCKAIFRLGIVSPYIL